MMKKMIRRSIVGTALLAVFYATPVYAAQLTVQKSDVITVLKNCSPYFIAIGVILIAAIAFIVYCKKFEKPKKKFLRLQTLLALILALTTVLNLVCLGPVSTLLNVMVQDKAEVSEDSVEEAKDLITNIAEEGTVMVKNNEILPLSKNTKKINVFGWASTNPCYGGTGSGAVDTTNCVTFLDGLEAGGYEVNQTLVNMYTSYAKERPAADMMTVDWTLPEPTTDYYTDEIMKEAKEFSDVAIITIARVGGEGTDLPTDFGAKNEDGSDLYTYTNNSDEYDDFTDGQTYLELSQTEKKMVELVCENFDKVIVIYNSANAMELGWVDEYDAIGAVLCCPGAGETGFAALGSILNGDVNPSGKLADTYVYDLTKAPYFNNFGDFTYDNMDEFAWEEMGQKRDVNFVEYSESIYVGYKFYETAFAEAEAGNMDYDYKSMVQYPFGYGLSYTTFEQKISHFEENDDGFTNYDTATAVPDNYTMDEERKANYKNISNYDIESMNDDSDTMPTTGVSNGLVLADLRGLDYDDSKWDELLDEMSVSDMSSLISGGGYQTAAVDSIEKVSTTDNDGPANIYNNYTGAAGNAYPSEVMLANTWNKELAKAMGESIGKEADELDVSGWYAPGMNIHRSAFGGRNFEYYSEDSILSGYMAAAEIQGANKYGVYSYIKHFALNDQETNRIYQMCTWANEQSIREIYLKPFEIAIKDGNSGAVMIGHNYIGDKWTGASYALCTTVLRDEWGFNGLLSTDMFCGYGYYDADIAIRSGVDSMLNPMGFEDANVTDTSSATSVTAMRNSCHHILYTVVNSRAYNDENMVYHMVLWKQIMIGVDAGIAILLILLEVLILRWRKKENK